MLERTTRGGSGRRHLEAILESDLERCTDGLDKLIERQRRLGRLRGEALSVESRSIEVTRDWIRNQADAIKSVYARIHR